MAFKKQRAASHSSTEADILSHDVGLRVEGNSSIQFVRQNPYCTRKLEVTSSLIIKNQILEHHEQLGDINDVPPT